jgi:hypothetical protein
MRRRAAASRAAASTASVTDACTGITSSSATSRTTVRAPGSQTTSRRHDPQPRARLAARINASRDEESHAPAPGRSAISPVAPRPEPRTPRRRERVG